MIRVFVIDFLTWCYRMFWHLISRCCHLMANLWILLRILMPVVHFWETEAGRPPSTVRVGSHERYGIGSPFISHAINALSFIAAAIGTPREMASPLPLKCLSKPGTYVKTHGIIFNAPQSLRTSLSKTPGPIANNKLACVTPLVPLGTWIEVITCTYTPTPSSHEYDV